MDDLEAENAVVVRPQDLYSISISLSTALDHFPEEEPVLVVVNSLTTLAVFNTENTVVKFSRQLISKVGDAESPAVLITMSGEDQEEFIGKLRQFTDGQVELG
ncbi:MAG: hypothetical protein SVQ76_02725 [Candidatus Nanohaloarchaea archaeon]|nr:hypothetical protein [Candidatus Nanohaloarchaea archaeon]